MTAAPDGTVTVRPAPTRARRTAAIVLSVLAAVLVLMSGWLTLTIVTAREVQPVGTEVPVPGGHVTVQSVEHALPAELGVPLPVGTHAVAVTLVLAADEGTDLVARSADFTIEGTGIEGVVEPSRATPPDVTVANGGLVAMTLMYAVVDNSTDLALTLPGGERVSAEHEDHPGDAEKT